MFYLQILPMPQFILVPLPWSPAMDKQHQQAQLFLNRWSLN